MAYRHFLRPLLAALLLMSVIGLAPRVMAQGSQMVWSRVGGVGTEVDLMSVFMLDRANAWSVGANRPRTAGYAYRLTLRDGRWQAEQAAGFSRPLYALSAIAANNIWAVGGQGLIVHYDGASWREVESPVPDAELAAIQMLGDGSQGWAMGSRYDSGQAQSVPVAMRYSDGRWQTASIESGPGGSRVASLHLSADGGYAVGSQLWRLSGGAWRLEPSPQLCGGVGCAGGFDKVRTIDADRAIAVGSWTGICAACTSHLYLAERGRDGWGARYADQQHELLPAPSGFPDTTTLGGLYLTDAGHGLAVGNRRHPNAEGVYGPGTVSIFGLRYSDGSWSHEPILSAVQESVSDLYMADSEHALLVGSGGLLVSYGYGSQDGPAGDPTGRVPDPRLPGVAYFPETGHTLRGAFYSYWQRYGGLAQFGYPLSEEYSEVSETDGKTYTVQYFERARFEHHPEHAGTPYEVLLGLLGRTVTAGRMGEAPFQPAAPSGQPGSRYFAETQHTMAAEFVGYWDSHGGLAIYGYPISEPFIERNAADGKDYLVQYFERNRFEHHPEHAGTPYEVLLGLLGSEVLAVTR